MSTPNEQNEQSATPSSKTTKLSTRKYLIFNLSGSVYGVPLSDVKEVIGLPSCVPVPNSPAYFLGLINLRGKVISAIDLKRKLSVPTVSAAVKRPAVILTEITSITIGCVVDSIQEVLNIPEEQIERSIEFMRDRELIQGVARLQGRPMIILLDMKKTTDISEVVKLKAAA